MQGMKTSHTKETKTKHKNGKELDNENKQYEK